MEKIVKTEAEWRALLDNNQYKVARGHGTERAGSGKYAYSKDPGVYNCICCGQPVFDSDAKFESGTGWPSFFEPINPEAIETTTDRSFFMTRVEVHCARCDGHLGHVFEDGPHPTGLRYCMNSASLDMVSKDAAEDAAE
ncbi:MAG: peptide-methionine (R)-S-oxide reductase MsrB [Proteobacteria bacterium]|nr:peptide-methionine (R)-S-oxide reductase MsrB [Pseudomonadota bacterium]